VGASCGRLRCKSKNYYVHASSGREEAGVVPNGASATARETPGKDPDPELSDSSKRAVKSRQLSSALLPGVDKKGTNDLYALRKMRLFDQFVKI